MTSLIGDALLFKNDGFVASIIKYFTQSPYSHAAVIVDSYKLKGKDYVDVIESTFLSGVHKSTYKLDSKKYNVFTHRHINYKKRELIKDGCYRMIKRGYDWTGILYRCWLTVTFRKRSPNKWDDKDSFFCSELVAVMYKDNGLIINDHISTANITPGNIADSKYMEKIS